MASERLKAWAELVNQGAGKGEAALKVGYAQSTAEKRTDWLTKCAVREGLLPDPERLRDQVSRRQQLMDEHLDELAEMLGMVREKIRAVLEADPARAAALIADVQVRMMDEVQNRTIGRPPVHIHGHKDGAEDEDREIVVRVIHGEPDAS